MIATRRTGWYLRVLASGQMPAAADPTSHPTPPGAAASGAPRPPALAAPAEMAWRGPQRGCASEANAAATIAAGAELVLEARPYPQWTVARALEVFYACKASGPTADAAALAACPALSPKWRERLTRGS